MNIRSKEERKRETDIIVKQLCNLRINTSYTEVIELFKCIQKYVNDGIEQKIKIPFPAINRLIIGVLPLDKKKKLWIKLEYHEYDIKKYSDYIDKNDF